MKKYLALALVAALTLMLPRRGNGVEPEEIIESSGVQGGLVAVIGCDDISLAAALAERESLLACGLDSDEQVVSQARRSLREQGIYGDGVTVSRLTDAELPFIDSTVNMIVVSEGDENIPAVEMYRVLAPRGVIVDLRGDEAQVTHKPWPEEIDDWPHYLYDASNNAVSRDSKVSPPRGLHWTCGPKYARSHEHFGSVCAMVSDAGRIFYIHDSGPISSVFLPPEWTLTARDAFSGVQLWTRSVGNWESQLRGFRSGPPEIGRRMVAGGGRLYVALGYGEPVSVLDPTTGKTLEVLEGSDGARELIYADETLYVLADDMTAEDHQRRKRWFNQRAPKLKGYAYPKEPIPMYGKQRIVAFDVDSGQQLWCNKNDRASGEIMPATLAVSAGRVCFQATHHVVCLDAGSGKEQWRSERPVAISRYTWATPTLVIHDGVVLSGDRMPQENIGDPPEQGSKWIMDNHHQMNPQPGEMIAFAVEDGKELWRAPAFENYTVPMDIFVIDDVVWSGHIRSKRHPGFTKGRDLRTGEVTMEIPHNKEFYDLQMGHNRCYRNKATCRYLILGRDGIEFVDPEQGRGSGHWWVRGTCQYGVMPANGMVYVPVHSCACHPEEKLDGFNTLGPNSAAPTSRAGGSAQLEKGPAYGSGADNSAAGSGDWPTYRRDARRSGYQDLDGPRNVEPVWTTQCSAPLTAPVCARGTVYVAEKDNHTLRAIDAQNGNKRWSFIANGRIDSPPTLCRGLCLFGTRNGFVYCVRATDGQLVWRFRAAPRNRMLFSRKQLESAWPVHGSVLVDETSPSENPTVYFAAGRTSHLDGGIRLYALDMITGQQRHSTTVTMMSDSEAEDVIAARALPDILSLQDNSVFMRHLRLSRKLEPRKPDVRHLYAPGGFLDDSWWHRTYWIFGTRMMSGYGGWPKVGNVTPAGRLLAFDGGELIYGYGRMSYRAGAGHVSPDATEDYQLFAEVRSPEPEAAKKSQQNNRRNRGGRRQFQWSQHLPFIARALVLCRDSLLVAGGANLPDADGDSGPGTLRVVARKEGAKHTQCALSAAPVLD
ncbi:MAG: PQQ-binding-like beta-propeller repeat protein, partial [Planctomycetota bacterium]